MATPMSFETITDADKGGELIHKYIRRQRVEYPDDLSDLISEIAAELLCSVDACHRADFLLREKNDKKGAGAAMNEVMTAITTFKNQLGFLVSQADYCLHGVTGTRLANEQYPHKPNNRLPILPASTIASGLKSIKSDFRNWRIERRTGGWVLAVETHPIKIEDPRYDVVVDFGPFSIELQLSQLARGVSKPYHLIALQPNSCDGQVHPHVSSKLLCEGGGAVMIEKALKVGDIQSFLIITSQVLSTYNPSSPYLRLEYWSKKLPRGPNPRPHANFGADESVESVCSICSEEASETFECNQCGGRACEECSEFCETHSRTVCQRCKERMRSDRTACSGCRELGRSGCVIEERQACADCGGNFMPIEMVRCSHQSRYMCRTCFDNHVNEQRPCCANWENAPSCAMARHLPRSETGFANTVAPASVAGPADMDTLNQAMRRPRNSMLDAQVEMPIPAEPQAPRDGSGPERAPDGGPADDGVGGFGPPQTNAGGGATGPTGPTATTG